MGTGPGAHDVAAAWHGRSRWGPFVALSVLALSSAVDLTFHAEYRAPDVLGRASWTGSVGGTGPIRNAGLPPADLMAPSIPTSSGLLTIGVPETAHRELRELRELQASLDRRVVAEVCAPLRAVDDAVSAEAAAPRSVRVARHGDVVDLTVPASDVRGPRAPRAITALRLALEGGVVHAVEERTVADPASGGLPPRVDDHVVAVYGDVGL